MIYLSIAIAYKDKYFHGFGNLPCILYGFDNLKDALESKSEMEQEGYRDVMCFVVYGRLPEIIGYKTQVS